MFVLMVQQRWYRTTVVVGLPDAGSQRISLDDIDHSAWDRLLRKFVDQSGVDYAAWKFDSQASDELEHYLNTLAAGDPQLPATRAARLAFWINAYNALTVYGILREHPTSSIRNHTPRLVGYHIWRDLLLRVADRTYSLEQIEHEQLRTLDEPRIHFAIVCASRGCPPLRDEAYRAELLDRQLADNARLFFADASCFQFDEQLQRMTVSPILQWFATDFGPDRRERLRTIAPYLPSEAARNAAARGDARVEYLDYDWSLNERR